MKSSSLVLDTQAWKIFFEARNETYSLLDILIKGYNVYLAHKVLKEIATKQAENFPELFNFIRSNMKLIKQVDRFNIALNKCRAFTKSALVFLAKKLERETKHSFKEIMSHFDEGEIDAVAHCLFLSRVKPNDSIFITQDNSIIKPLQEFFHMHQIGQVMRCDEFISSLELQIYKSPYTMSLLSRYGIVPSNIQIILESWVEKVKSYSKTPSHFTPWCQSYTFKPCRNRQCISSLRS